MGHTQKAKKELLARVDFQETENVLDTVKPTGLIRRMLRLATDPDGEGVVLDFFAGSAATADAVLQQNREDGGDRKFVCVQFPEPLPKPEEGLDPLSDVAMARIRGAVEELRAAEGIQAELGDEGEWDEDLGVRVFRLARSHIRRWPEDLEPDMDPVEYLEQMEAFLDPLEDGWRPEPLLLEIALPEGFGLDVRVEEAQDVEGNTVHRVTNPENGRGFHICLDDEVSVEAVEPLDLGKDDLSGGAGRIRFPNFSVEMETGTGKTYAYLRTALELFERYGFRKYIIVVPFVAIREGVLKTLRMTRDHFRALYDNVPYRFHPYDSSNLAQVRNFALSDSVEFMVMTLASFNKAMGKGRSGNVIYRPDDRLQGETPVDLIRETNPALILDEPQNMESEKSVKALSALNPSFALRYSATHRRPYNVVYRLDPYEAYRRGLVKRVEVAGAEEEDANRPFLRLDEVRTGKRSVSARVQVQSLLQDGTLKKKTITVRGGDDLEETTGNPVYEGLVVSEIDAREPVVRFTDGTELGPGRDHGPDKEVVFDAQIRYTIEEHLKKQERLRDHGIKVLSLFFIDRVDNYAGEDPVIRRLFDQAFDEIKRGYEAWGDLDPEEVRAAYFASRTTREGETVYEDSKTGEAQRDEEAYDLIMRDKESLLSFPEEGDRPEERRKKAGGVHLLPFRATRRLGQSQPLPDLHAERERLGDEKAAGDRPRNPVGGGPVGATGSRRGCERPHRRR